MKKIIISIVCIFLAIFLVAGGICAYFLYDHQKNAFTADDIPFGLEWGMSQKAVEDWLFDEYGLVCDTKIDDVMAYDDCTYDDIEMRVALLFLDDELNCVQVILVDTKYPKKWVYNELLKIYQKGALLEIIEKDLPKGREYIMEYNTVRISYTDKGIFWITNDIEDCIYPNGNYMKDMVTAAEKMGVKSVTIPEGETATSYLLSAD